VISHVDTWYVQDNILITQDGQACLRDFGIARAFTYDTYKPETLRYMAPEQLKAYYPLPPGNFSGKSDVYSLAMTSFRVSYSAADHPTT
jgi:serine/threonine protein kinase